LFTNGPDVDAFFEAITGDDLLGVAGHAIDT